MTEKFYHIVTYGCQMNVHESEKIAGQLNALGYTLTADIQKADIIVFNTCCIRESAETHAMGNIGAVKPIKSARKDIIVAVVGCMSQEKGMAELLIKKFPFINIVLGTHNIDKLSDSIKAVLENKNRVTEVVENCGYTGKDVPIKRDRTLNAWVDIMYGCNNYCTYCIVPFVRGREISRPVEEILAEVKSLVQEKKYKIVTLLGQNVNSYSSEFNGEKVNFATLLRLVNDIEGDFRIKFMTSNPHDLNDEVINSMAQCNKVSRCLHLPVQSGSSKILRLMNRRYTREHYLELVSLVRAKMPDITLTTDIIVGFPGETEEDFMQTYSLVSQVGFTGAFIFMFSKRRGTAAEKMPNQIDIAVKRDRIHRLLALQNEITEEISNKSIGKVFEVLVESTAKGEALASTDFSKVVRIKDPNLKVGDIVKVKITAVKGSKLLGEIYLGE